jgi:hypothetical protein
MKKPVSGKECLSNKNKHRNKAEVQVTQTPSPYTVLNRSEWSL